MRPGRQPGSAHGRPARPLVWFLLVVLAACGGESDDPTGPPGPGEVAASLLEVTSLDDPPGEKLAVLFEPDSLVGERTALLEALSGLPASLDPEIKAVERPGTGDTAFVDLAAELPGGGSARVTVRLSAHETGAWKVTWFQGSDVEWPPPRTRRGESLTTSSHPGMGPAR